MDAALWRRGRAENREKTPYKSAILPNVRQSLDPTDRRIAAALMAAPRASWRTVAHCLNLSERTVVRRAGPLLADRTVRTTAIRNPDCFRQIIPMALRIECRGGQLRALADTLARRPDTYWVDILGSGDEIGTVVFLNGAEARNALLLHDLPATSAVRSWTSHSLLRVFPSVLRWTGDVLTAEELAALPRQSPVVPDRPHEPLAIDPPLIDALVQNARTPYSELAERAGVTPATARRRVETLLRAQAVRLAAEMDLALLGARTEALLWMTVAPGVLGDTAEALCDHPHVRFVAATTGPSNLLAAVAGSDLGALYRFLTETVGALDGITGIETTPILTTVKRTGLLRPARG